ncbi:thioredoxin H1 [Manihot esculenta]|uniref:Thioredoxin domain-containing protein n=1 Tax=Manihot esculenta TaxID=3983 RepID=A0A2C9VWH6_MANES|nr:thioredoxin H1 [Manihot esculenta]OAY50655.1 hypothetical protein MANES_05G153800v8 [Manihot esculenta]
MLLRGCRFSSKEIINFRAIVKSKKKTSIQNSEKMAEEGQVISCHTVQGWTEQLERGQQSNKLIVVDFTASWCGPCRLIAPILADLAKKMPNVTFLKVDVDELRSVAEDWAVEAMPTFMFLKEGRIVDKVVGAKKEELQATITKHAT